MVHPKWVPQLADSEALLRNLSGVSTKGQRTVLVPNLKGLQRALKCGVQRVAVFIAASETFSQKNTNRSISQSLEQTAETVLAARTAGLTVRGYLSTAFVCPFESKVPPKWAAQLARKLLEFGCDEVSLGDTIGAAVPEDIDELMSELEGVPQQRLALHLHDTYGTALANVSRGLQRGLRCFDSSVGGSGGCPYAPGASGNLPTEDLLYLLEKGGWDHGIDRDGALEAARFLEKALKTTLPSHQLALTRRSRELSSQLRD